VKLVQVTRNVRILFMLMLYARPSCKVAKNTHLDCLLGLYWTGLTLLNGFSFLVIFSFFIFGRAVV